MLFIYNPLVNIFKKSKADAPSAEPIPLRRYIESAIPNFDLNYFWSRNTRLLELRPMRCEDLCGANKIDWC
jgi:hypothetical protein